MATERILFLPDNPTTWTAEGMRTHLRIGKMNAAFYQTIFGWNDTQLHEAIERANDALEKANTTPSETLSPIRFSKGTRLWTPGALKRLGAEADLVKTSIMTDRLFCLPHQKNDWLKPLWFMRDMTFFGRAPETVYGFPSITQKFMQYAREQARASLKLEASAEMGGTDVETPTSGKSLSPELTKKRGTSPLDRNGKAARASLHGERSSPGSSNEVKHGNAPVRSNTLLENADIHVGWILQQENGSFVLEKDFRSLRTWLVSPENCRYDYKEIHESLGMVHDPRLSLFWFDDITGEPWAVKSDHAVAGAIERMHSKGKICFLLAIDIEHVRSLTPGEREIEKQVVQTLPLNLSVPVSSVGEDQTPRSVPSHPTATPGRRSAKTPYMIPGISVSLARILGEQVMRSRVGCDK